jgi:isovaleryl-CoA dehydrogenase
MFVQIEACRLLCYKAVMLADLAKGWGKGTEVHMVSSAAILCSGGIAAKVTKEAIQIHGGYGYCIKYPVQRYWRGGKLATIGAGTSEMRRLIIAREILGNG